MGFSQATKCRKRGKIPTRGSSRKTHFATHRNKETQKVTITKNPKGNKPSRKKGVHGIKNEKETGERKKLPELGRELRELSTLERAFSMQLPIEKERESKKKATKEERKTLWNFAEKLESFVLSTLLSLLLQHLVLLFFSQLLRLASNIKSIQENTLPFLD